METSPKLILAPDILAATRAETLAFPGVETGGLWLGARTPEAFHVTGWIPAGPRAVHNPGSFGPDEQYQNWEWRRRLAANPQLRIIAMWHSHPSWLTHPSGTDVAAARSVLASWGLAQPELVVGIAVAPERNLSLRAFYMTQESQAFSEIGWTEEPQRVGGRAPWLGSHSGRTYLNELLENLHRLGVGFRTRVRGESLRLDLDPGRGAITIPREFPFEPAWWSCGRRRWNLPTRARELRRYLRKALRSLTIAGRSGR